MPTRGMMLKLAGDERRNTISLDYGISVEIPESVVEELEEPIEKMCEVAAEMHTQFLREMILAVYGVPVQVRFEWLP